ncbi:MAG TPA: thiamine diphosphokinase [Candidatus Limnocylindrales bacterium]|nr:thiamine diphosphokinase [Candidatus Limnocylindrales bacterium]
MAASRGAIVLADGDVPSRDLLDTTWPGWLDGIELVVAADGGARHATALRLPIDIWVGDGDSVDAELLARLEADGVDIRRVPAEKDETDAELAVATAAAAGAGQVIVLGGLGGPRLDHALANLGLVQHPALAWDGAVLYDAGCARISILTGPATRNLHGREGDVVTLLPVGATARGVRTTNLRYPLVAEDLELGRTRGVSNVRSAPEATVSLESGRLLVIETPVTVGR